MHIIRYTSSSGSIALGVLQNGQLIGRFPLKVELHHLLRRSADELRAQIEQRMQPGRTTHADFSLLAPIDGETEVRAAGVTYKRSEEGETDVTTSHYGCDIIHRVPARSQPLAL